MPDPSHAFLGKWQRISDTGPGDPSELAAGYVEFREDGVLLTLIRDDNADTFLLTNAAAYTLTNASQLQVTGSCWQSWRRYTCSRLYSFELLEDTLWITADWQAEYRRIGGLSQDIPPTLAPPFPSPTP